MAAHNLVNLIGYVSDPPDVLNKGTEEQCVIVRLQTTRRRRDGLHSSEFQKVILYYDQNEALNFNADMTEKERMSLAQKHDDIMSRLSDLKLYDLIEIKGVFCLLSMDKISDCPECGEENVKEHGSYPVVYPQFVLKLQNYSSPALVDYRMPDALLKQKFEEYSNSVLMIGTVVSEPENLNIRGTICCRYKMVVDRKYFIPTQAEIKEDYIFIYSYGKQAEQDLRHLCIGAEIMVDGFLRVREVRMDMECVECGMTYSYDDVAAELVPYSIEYIKGHMTDLDIKKMEEEEARQAIQSLL